MPEHEPFALVATDVKTNSEALKFAPAGWVENMTTAAATRINPYVGPRSFRAGEALYGRDREVLELLDLVIAERIVLLYSPSGAGKTSLVQAALVPALEREGFVVRPMMRVGMEPPAGLPAESQVNRYVLSSLLSLEEGLAAAQQKPMAELAGTSFQEYLKPSHTSAGGTNPGNSTRDGSTANEVLIFDQFEEILTVDPTDQAAKEVFFAQVGAVLRDRRRWALFSMREDYVAALDPYLRPIPTRLGNTYRLDLLGEQAAQQAVQQPAVKVGIDFTNAAARKLVDNLRRVRVQRTDGSIEEQLGPYVEPVQLQVVCSRLWDRLPENAAQVVEADIAGIGDVDTALADYYAERVAAAADKTGCRERDIREWCDTQLITEQGIRSQVLQAQDRSQGLDNNAIWALVDAHLVRAEKRRGATWFELAHDRLIGPVRANNARWFESNLSAVQRVASLWDKQSRPNGLLLRGPALVDGELWASAHASELTPVENDFLQACREAQKQTKRMRRLRVSLIVFTALALVAAGAALFFLRLATKAKARAENASVVLNGMLLQMFAIKDMAQVPKRSLLFALEYSALLKERKDPDFVPGSLMVFNELFHMLPSGKSVGWPAVVASTTAISRDGQKVAVAAINGSIEIRNVNPNAQVIMLPAQSNHAISAMSFSDDARWLASGAEDNWVYLWDLHNPQSKPQRLPGHTKYSNTLAFTPDGHWLAIASNEETNGTVQKPEIKSTVQMWDLTVTPPFKGPSGTTKDWIQALAFSPDGRKLLSAIDNYAWLCDVPPDLSTAKGLCLGNLAVRINRSTPQRVAAITFSPDGRWLAFGGGLAVVLYDRKENNSQTITGPTGNVMALAFSRDSAWLAISGKDQVIRLWGLETQKPIFSSVLTGHESSVTSLAFYRHADAQELITASENDGVMRWIIPSRTLEPVTLETTGHKPWVLAFSHNGTWLATGGTEGGVRLWNLAKSMSENIPLQQAGPGITAIEFSPDSHWLVAASKDDGPAKAWDMSKPDSTPFPVQHDKVLAIAFSPDGRRMATSSLAEVRLWALDDPSPFAKSISLPGSGSSLESFSFSRDGKWLAAANGASVEAWDLTSVDPSGYHRFPIAECEANISGVALSPDGHLLAATCGSSAHLWDISKPSSPASVMNQAFDDSAFSPLFSKDGRWFVARSLEGTVVLLDVRHSGSKPVLLQVPGRQSVTDVRFSPDGHLLMTASNDSIIRMWSLNDLDTPGFFPGFDNRIQSAAFSDNGRWYVTVSDDNIVRVWLMNVDDLIEVACEFAGRNLSPTEWRQMPGIKPYRQTCSQFPPGVDSGTTKMPVSALIPDFMSKGKTRPGDNPVPGKP